MLLLKATVILSVAALFALALRRAPAAARHRVWTWTFAALVALPLLALALPAVPVPVPERLASPRPHGASVDAAVPPAAAVAVPASPVAATALDHDDGYPTIPEPAWTGFSTARVLAVAWMAGTLAALGALLVSCARVWRLADASTPVVDCTWMKAAAETATRLGVHGDVRLLRNAAISTPMAGGFLRPVIFLPNSSHAWASDRRDVVLAHELAHIAARDHQRHVLARVALALYWFHPLAWLAARQASAARESACDERVLALGTRPSTYARVLVELAESMQPGPPALTALPIVQRSLLEARVMAILNGTHHPSTSRRGLLPVLGVSALTLLLAAVSPAASPMPNEARWIDASPAADVPLPNPAAAGTIATARVSDAALPAGSQSAYKSGDCWGRFGDGDSFSGIMSVTGGGTILRERVGTVNDVHRVMLFTLSGIRLCVSGESVGPAESRDLPSQWIGRAKRVVLESVAGSNTYTMVFAEGAEQPQWQVNGVARPIDRTAEDWRARMLAALDARWEATVLRGQQTSLRGEITSVRGQETSLRGEITSLRGKVTSMRGRITSILGEETSLRGRITSLRGHETSLHGQITSARGAITSIKNGGIRSADADRLIADYEKEIARREEEIRDHNADAKIREIEKEIAAYDARGKAAAIEREIEAFDLDRKVAAVERRIADLKVSDKVRDIELEIDTLDADRRAAAIEKRLDEAAAKLKAAIASIR